MKNLIVCLSILLVLLSSLANAGQLEDGVEAYNKGNFQQAFGLLQPLAAQGVAQAQNILGVMYDAGQGVTQDYGQAVGWYRKAAELGYAKAHITLVVVMLLVKV